MDSNKFKPVRLLPGYGGYIHWNPKVPVDPATGLPNTTALPSGNSIDPKQVSNGTAGVYAGDDTDEEAVKLWWQVANEVQRRTGETYTGSTETRTQSMCTLYGHNFKLYHGFNESYEYCTLCDIKRNVE